MSSPAKLPLTDVEKAKLRKAKVKMMELHTYERVQITEMLDVSLERAKILKGLADFQHVPSIGFKLAEKLDFQLGFFSLLEVKERNGAMVFFNGIYAH